MCWFRLFIHKSLDTHLRSLCERLADEFNFGDLAVAWQYAVGGNPDFLGDFRYGLLIEVILLDGVLVEIDECHDLAAAVHNYALSNVRLVVDDGFELLRVNVLAVCTQDHALAATLDEDVAVLVHDAEVSSAEESVLGECIG